MWLKMLSLVLGELTPNFTSSGCGFGKRNPLLFPHVFNIAHPVFGEHMLNLAFLSKYLAVMPR